MPWAPARANEAFVSGDGTVIPARLPERRTAEGQPSRPMVRISHCPAAAFSDRLQLSPDKALGARIATAVVPRDYLAKHKDKP